VIKPALVGLAVPWASGGIEFNWPQHHRLATFMPVDTEIAYAADGSATVWCSDHDPMVRMKGMHGVCLHPGRAYVELKVQAYNRTPYVQTFLWWANVATRVHEAYQSFFPPDVHYVADHARRSMSQYPLASGFYYGVNYGERGRKGIPSGEVPRQFVPPHCQQTPGPRSANAELPDYAPNDLSFYANIPVPTSYMCMGSDQDFLGGYDYKAQAGIIHIANHHISPGKKQWTWGNHEFGYAWDRNLTEPDANGEFAPYIEIMAGVFTDNQPDFSFLQPGETRRWSQYWYPIQKIGPAQHANLNAAISLRATAPAARKVMRIGVAVTARQPKATVTLTAHGQSLGRFRRDLAPDQPFVADIILSKGVRDTDVLVCVTDQEGQEIISYQPKPRAKGKVPPPATEPPAPADIASADELFVIGLHLDQYRHATRCPTLYWREALRRDPLDSRCNNAIGLWHLKRGEFRPAETHFRRAIERLTRRNANPYDGEPYYNLGLCLRHLGRDDAAYAAFYKATWNQAWAGAAYHALAEIDCCRRDWDRAAEHIEQSCCTLGWNLRAMNLWAMVLRKQERFTAGEAFPKLNKAKDPLDWWTRYLLGQKPTCDTQTLLDVALDMARAGFFAEAIKLLGAQAPDRANRRAAHDPRNLGAAPLVHYYLGWLHTRLGDPKAAVGAFKQGAAAPPDYCFPARLEEIAILEAAMAANPKDARAPYYLGNLLYDRRRHAEAIRLWERSARLDPTYSVVWRNLGIGYFNIRRNAGMARAAYDKAFRVNPTDARLLLERDQLWKRLGEKPAKRLRAMAKRLDLVRQRDDLTVELCALYNQTGRHADALALVSRRRFQP
jgi:tetratricopeptide (TPR) repeat protein